MKFQIKRINTWGPESDYPDFVELLVDDSVVYEGPGDEAINSFVDGFLCALDSLNINFEYSVEDTVD